MVKVLSKEGAKFHLVNQDGLPLCFGFNRANRAWVNFELSDMPLSSWLKSDWHCLNCAQVFSIWAFGQFKDQIVDFIGSSGLSTFPIEFEKDGSWKFNGASKWPDVRIVKGDGYKRR